MRGPCPWHEVAVLVKASSEDRKGALVLPSEGDKLLFTPGPFTTRLSVKQAMLHDTRSWHFEFNTKVKWIREKILEIAVLSREASGEAVCFQGIGAFALSLAFVSLAGVSARAEMTPVPTTYVLPSSAADTTQRGFIWRFHQVTRGQNDSLAFTEAQLAGLEGTNIANPTAQGVAIAPGLPPSPATAPITFEISTVINVDKVDGSFGNFAPDDLMPGIDPSASFTDNLAAEILTYLDLPAGDITIGINSDDGFRMTVGGPDPGDRFAAVNVGQFDGSPGAADTIFTFHVTQAGLYPTRVIWENGGGDANIEWFSVLPDGITDVLINDTNTVGHINAYRAVTSPGRSYASVFIPAPGDNKVSPDDAVNIVLVDGANAIAPGTVQLILDGVTVNATVGKTNKQTTISYKPAGLWASASTHAGRLLYSDDASPPKTATNDWTFGVITYRNVVLLQPIYLENFETVALGGLAAGWTATNATDSIDPGLDINDAHSDSYRDWLVIDRNQVFYNGDPNNPTPVWEEGDPNGRVTHIAPGQAENGKLLTADELMVGRFLYAESSERSGNQVQVVFSSNYDLTGKSNIWVSYHSSYVQNQDAIASLEYSIDGGANWLPVVYMLQCCIDGQDAEADIHRFPDGTVDAVTTLETFVDPEAAYGLNYGAFIGAPITQALAPHIEGRVNDDLIESHRVELYPLPLAANHTQVKFRFMQAGTGSWYWGVDNFGIYSIAPVSGLPIQLSSSRSGADLVITWTGGQGPFTLQRRADLNAATTWQELGGPITASTVTVNNAFTGVQGYFRIKGQ